MKTKEIVEEGVIKLKIKILCIFLIIILILMTLITPIFYPEILNASIPNVMV